MEKRVALVLALVLAVSINPAKGSKILGVLPVDNKSHNILGTAIMRTLAEAGHEVTVITPFRSDVRLPNYRQIVLTGMQDFDKNEKPNFFDFYGAGPVAFEVMMIILYEIFPAKTCDFVLKHPNVVSLLNSDEKFDAVLVETFISEPLYGFAQHFDAPLITYSAFGNSLWTCHLVGAPPPPIDHARFWDRLMYTAMEYVDRAYYKWRYMAQQKRIYDAAFPNAKLSFDQQMRNVSLVLLNQHFSISTALSYPPNMVEVGGIHIDEPKSLPIDLQEFLDEAKEGVIYFSMGSNVKSIDFPEEKRTALLTAFSKLKQRVLWKFENDTLPNLPKNVWIRPWMPQNDILAHSNVVLFISHGGLLGTMESLYHGKPLVGIPIFGDQPINVENAVQAGFAVSVNYATMSETTVLQAIRTVLDNPSYARNAKFLSERFKDKPISPKELAVYWVEYVIRYGGAVHLRPSTVDLPLLQYYTIDVHATLVIIVCLTIYLNVYLLRKILKKILKRRTPTVNKKKRS